MRLILAILLSTVGLCEARAESVTAATGGIATGLTYDVGLSLAYIDKLARPGAGAIAPLAATTGRVTTTPRALGLERLRVALTWTAVRSTSLSLVLRPDTVNRAQDASAAGPIRDFDARAGALGSDVSLADPRRGGEPYRPAPTIRLADAYAITLHPFSSLAASAGVFESLELPAAAYRTPLPFGLETRFPEKFSAIRARWQRLNTEPATAASLEAGPAGLSSNVYVLQGAEDRVESLAARPGSQDRAPVAQDPFLGGAGSVSFAPSNGIELGVLAGYGDAAQATGGKRTEVFAQVASYVKAGNVSLGLDLRYASESWRGAPENFKTRVQTSSKASAAYHLSPRQRLLAGASLGRSDRAALADPAKLAALNGWGAEFGFLSVLGEGLEISVIAAHERRERKESGDEAGAFIDADGKDHATLRRIGVTLAYQLNDNA